MTLDISQQFHERSEVAARKQAVLFEVFKDLQGTFHLAAASLESVLITKAQAFHIFGLESLRQLNDQRLEFVGLLDRPVVKIEVVLTLKWLAEAFSRRKLRHDSNATSRPSRSRSNAGAHVYTRTLMHALDPTPICKNLITNCAHAQ